jgi:hypothetical protein
MRRRTGYTRRSRSGCTRTGGGCGWYVWRYIGVRCEQRVLVSIEMWDVNVVASPVRGQVKGVLDVNLGQDDAPHVVQVARESRQQQEHTHARD